MLSLGRNSIILPVGTEWLRLSLRMVTRGVDKSFIVCGVAELDEQPPQLLMIIFGLDRVT